MIFVIDELSLGRKTQVNFWTEASIMYAVWARKVTISWNLERLFSKSIFFNFLKTIIHEIYIIVLFGKR